MENNHLFWGEQMSVIQVNHNLSSLVQGFGRVGGAGTGLGGSGTGQRGVDQSLGSHVPHGQNVGSASGQVCLGSGKFMLHVCYPMQIAPIYCMTEFCSWDITRG